MNKNNSYESTEILYNTFLFYDYFKSATTNFIQ